MPSDKQSPDPGARPGHIRTPWYHGWNIVAVCVLSQVASLGVATNCFTFFLKGWSAEFGMPVSELIIAIPIFSTTCAIMSPFAGAVADRFPMRSIMTTAMFGIVVFHFIIGFVSAGWQILALYAVFLPIAVVFSTGIPSQTLVSRWFVYRRGLAFSISAVGLVGAGILFPPLAVWLIAAVGWRATWWIFGAGILVFVVPLMILVLRERPGAVEGRKYIIAQDDDDESASLTVRDILGRRNFWITIAVFVPLLLSNSAMGMNFAPFVTMRGLTVGEAAVLVGVYNLAAMAGKLLTGVLSDRFGNRVPLVLLSLLGTAGTFWLATAHGATALTIGFVLLGFSQGAWVLLASCTAAEFGSKGFARAYGIASIFSVLTTFSPPVLARIQEQSGSYTAGIIGLGLICLIAVVAGFFFEDRRGRATHALAIATAG